MDGHVVCVGGRLQLFTCCYVEVMEAIFLHELEEDSVFHSSECAFEIRVGCVYVTLGDLCIFVHHVVC